MGKLSAFWVAGIVAGFGASATASIQPPNELGKLHANAVLQPKAASSATIRSVLPPLRMNAAQKRRAGYAKVDNALAQMSEAVTSLPHDRLMSTFHSAFPKARFSQQVPLSVPMVSVNMHVEGDREGVKRQLSALGAQHLSSFKNLVSAHIPADRIKEIAAISDIRAIHLAMASTRTGSVTAQGDIIQSTYAIRSPYTVPGYTGAGYTVGVLSDSFACADQPDVAAGYTDDVASKDLPADVNVLSELEGCAGGTDEGRAMAQLVYDIAPGVNLAFHTAFNGEADFAQGILDLADPNLGNAQIIVDDVFYFDEPVFQDGVVAQAAQQVHDAGVAYFSSAGNDARQSYEANWVDSGTQGLPGDDNEGEELMAFKYADGTYSNVLPTIMPDSGVVYLTLQWDQPFVTGAPDSGGATSSMDICLVDIIPEDPGYGHVIPGTCSALTGPNAIGEDPIVITGIENGSGLIEFGVEIGLVPNLDAPPVPGKNGVPPLTPPGRIKVSFIDDGLGTNAIPGFATYSGTVFGHAAAAGAAAVGASYFRGNPLCNPDIYPTFALEPYSSSGGDPILFDKDGNRLVTQEVRQKPQFVAPDGDNTTFFAFNLGERDSNVPGCANSPTSWNFFGTSAAAPHAAGMAALLWEAGPDQTNDMVVSAMEHSAVMQMLSGDWATYNPLEPIVSPSNPVYVLQNSVNYDTGYGFIQGYYALPYVLLQANPGTQQFVPQGGRVTLDGSASNVPTGSHPTYIWTQVSGPTVKLSDATTAHPWFQTTDTANYAFVLTIALDNGRVSATSAPVAVTVTGGPGPGGSGGGGAIGLGLLIPGFMAAALRRRRKS